MKRIVILVFIVINFSYLHSQEILTFSKTVNIDNIKKKKLYKEFSNWLNNQGSFTNISENKEDELTANGFLSYKNPVKYENSTNLTRIYAQQTEGKLDFKLKISVKDNQYTIILTEIKHVPGNKSNNISFGTITDNVSAPANIIEEAGEKWSNDVWADIKNQIRKKFDDINSSLQNNYASVN
jgi:hypothetical protein